MSARDLALPGFRFWISRARFWFAPGPFRSKASLSVPPPICLPCTSEHNQ